MFNKNFLQILLLIAVLFASMGFTGTASAYSCGTSYTVQKGDTLGSIATACGTSTAALKLANPGLGQYIYAGQALVLPGAYWDNGNGYGTYVVARGDTLKALANRFGTSMDVLASLNDINNYNLIYEGQRLTVPGGAAVPVPPPSSPPPVSGNAYTIQKGDTLRKIADRIGVTVRDILAVNPKITNANLIYVGQVINLPASASHHTVQSGDTLKKIAARYGTTLDALITLNPQIKDINRIYVGQVVRVW
ncbi:MAG: LysM peptidoglycan-binding domain-containing protein [Anaerolineales bacterium]|nr:MAG: LysM peptidoglycan-binding domain-containing protein [Anaerolineales bacterium]